MSVIDIFPYLFLGHLFGDYVLQTGYIAAKKSKDIKVLGIHIGLLFLSQLVFVFGEGFGIKHFLAIAMLSGIHFLIDLIKFHCKTAFCNSWKYYLIDQLFHLLSLLSVAPFFRQSSPIFTSHCGYCRCDHDFQCIFYRNSISSDSKKRYLQERLHRIFHEDGRTNNLFHLCMVFLNLCIAMRILDIQEEIYV